jgi:hypothetical protein
VKAYIGVAVAVLYADNHVANDSHTWTVPEKLLVCGFCIKLLSLYELVVEDTKEALKSIGLTMNRRGEGNIAVENYW